MNVNPLVVRCPRCGIDIAVQVNVTIEQRSDYEQFRISPNLIFPSGPTVTVAVVNSDMGEVWAHAEQHGYTRGYNDRARAEQRTLIEYGGRPSKPGLCGEPCYYCVSDGHNPCTNQRGHDGPHDCNGVEP